MSKFHKIVFDENHKDGMRLTADELSSGVWIFRKTYRQGKKDITSISCTVCEHEELTNFECYVQNIFIDLTTKSYFWRVKSWLLSKLFNIKLEHSTLRDLQAIFNNFSFHTVYFERSLDEDAKLIKWSVYGGRVGTGKTMNFR